MKYEDLTPDEQAALNRLRENALDTPDALASLDDAGRARVLEALSNAEAAASDDSGAAAAEGPTRDVVDDEPALETTPSLQRTGPSALAERLLAQKVSLAGKQIPLVPSSVAAVLVLVALILTVRACGGDGNPLERLSEAGEEAIERLDDAADEVDDDYLYAAADRVREDMRRLTREADADYGDFREVLEAGEAVGNLGQSIPRFVQAAASAAESSSDEDTTTAAVDAARVGAALVTNSKALNRAESLARKILDVHIDEHARRADSEEVDEYRRAAGDLIDAARANLVAHVAYQVARAELALASIEGTNRDKARDALEEARDAAQDAEEDYDQADDDFAYFGEQVEWRGFESFESSVPIRWRP